jgi:hypothetical protein
MSRSNSATRFWQYSRPNNCCCTCCLLARREDAPETEDLSATAIVTVLSHHSRALAVMTLSVLVPTSMLQTCPNYAGRKFRSDLTISNRQQVILCYPSPRIRASPPVLPLGSINFPCDIGPG